MKTYFENKITKNQISFCLTDKESIDEREIHSYHEILLYLGGNVELFTANGHRALKEPSILIIPAENFHFLKPQNSPGFTRLKISFSVGALENTPVSEIMDGLKIVDNFNEEIKYICDKLFNILRMNGKNAGFHAYSAFLMLISELDMYDIDEHRDNHIIKNGLMNSVSKYISDNLSENLDIKSLAEIIADIAAVSNCSTSYLSRIFKKHLGKSPYCYLTEYRMFVAEKLLRNQFSVTDVASMSGFSDSSVFIKRFKKSFGITPLKYKELYKQK